MVRIDDVDACAVGFKLRRRNFCVFRGKLGFDFDFRSVENRCAEELAPYWA